MPKAQCSDCTRSFTLTDRRRADDPQQCDFCLAGPLVKGDGLKLSAGRSFLAQRWLGLPPSVCRRFFAEVPNFLHDDLIDAGVMGLLRAAALYDPAKGFAFSTYASRCVWVAMSRWLSAYNRANRHLVCDTTWTHGESGAAWHPTYEPDPAEGLLTGEQEAEARDLLRFLRRREREVVSLRFGLGGRPTLKLDEVGKRFGLTKERVRQIQNAALEKMRLVTIQRSLQCR
jgi:RNA polymerase sigma factor (sigma-70 family)